MSKLPEVVQSLIREAAKESQEYDIGAEPIAIDQETKELLLRKRLYHMIRQPICSIPGKVWAALVTIIVLVSMVCTVTESTLARSAESVVSAWYFGLEIAFSLFFLLELIIYLLGQDTVAGCFRSSFLYIEVVNTLPIILETILLFIHPSVGGYIIKAMLVSRMLRLLQLLVDVNAGNGDFSIFVSAMKSSGFAILFLLYYLLIAIAGFTSLVYYAETSQCIFLADNVLVYKSSVTPMDVAFKTTYDSQRHVPCAFQNIFNAMWWGIVTVTTVGYGDTTPQTQAGRVIASFMMVISAVAMPLPIAIFSANLIELYLNRRVGLKTQKNVVKVLRLLRSKVGRAPTTSAGTGGSINV